MKRANFIFPLFFLAAVFFCGASAGTAEAKKTKNNYKTADFFNVSGD